jgi:hypothetical protein
VFPSFAKRAPCLSNAGPLPDGDRWRARGLDGTTWAVAGLVWSIIEALLLIGELPRVPVGLKAADQAPGRVHDGATMSHLSIDNSTFKRPVRGAGIGLYSTTAYIRASYSVCHNKFRINILWICKCNPLFLLM